MGTKPAAGSPAGRSSAAFDSLRRRASGSRRCLLDPVGPRRHGQQEVERLLAGHLGGPPGQDQLPSQEVRPAALVPGAHEQPAREPAVLAELQEGQRARGPDGPRQRVMAPFRQAQGGPHLRHEARHVDGLAQEVVGPALQGLHDVVVGVHAREEHEGDVLQLGGLLDLAEQGPAVHERHEHVAEDEVGHRVPHPRQGVTRIVEALHVEALAVQRGLHHAEDVGVVVDHHDALVQGHGNETMHRHPVPVNVWRFLGPTVRIAPHGDGGVPGLPWLLHRQEGGDGGHRRGPLRLRGRPHGRQPAGLPGAGGPQRLRGDAARSCPALLWARAHRRSWSRSRCTSGPPGR